VPYFLIGPDGKRVLTWEPRDSESTLSGFDLATGNELFSFNDRGRTINSVAFSADGKRAATGARDGSVRVFDLEKKGTMLPGGDWFLYEKGVGIGDLALTADGSVLAAGSDAGDLKICLVAGKETLKTIKAHSTGVIGCQISPDGKRIATVSADNAVKVWDTGSGAELRSWTIRGQDRGKFIVSVAFSPDGKQLAIGNANTTVFILALPD
jgi:WD40 repeat protein